MDYSLCVREKKKTLRRQKIRFQSLRIKIFVKDRKDYIKDTEEKQPIKNKQRMSVV